MTYQWQTVSSLSEKSRELLPTPPNFPATEDLDNASRRISLVYQNVIFNEEVEEQDVSFEEGDESRAVPVSAGTLIFFFRPIIAYLLAQRPDDRDNLAAHCRGPRPGTDTL